MREVSMPGAATDDVRVGGRRLAAAFTTLSLLVSGLLGLLFAHEAAASNPGKDAGDQPTGTGETGPATAATTPKSGAGSTTTTTRPGAGTPRATTNPRSPGATLSPPATSPSRTGSGRHTHSGGS